MRGVRHVTRLDGAHVHGGGVGLRRFVGRGLQEDLDALLGLLALISAWLSLAGGLCDLALRLSGLLLDE